MASENIPIGDSHFKDWIVHFAAVAAPNAAVLGLGPGDVSAMNTASANFSAAYEAAQASKATTRGLVQTKSALRVTSERTFRSYAKRILANPGVSDALKGQLGMIPGVTPLGPVAVPANLSATAYSNGINRLRWKRSGNPQGTVFTVEAKIGNASSFSIIASTTRASFNHTDQTPGVQVVYRVTASRGGVTSGASNEAVVYSASSPQIISLSTAA